MKILATIPLHLMDVQIEIVRAYIYFILRLAKYNEITFVICQAKKYKQYEEHGFISRLVAAGVKVLLLDKIISKAANKQMWKVDNVKIKRVLGSDYDLVLFYAYSISPTKQMRESFETFYSGEELKVTFNSMLTKYRQTYPFYYISRKYAIPTIQFIVDWLEPNLEEIYAGNCKVGRFGVYKQKELGVKFLPIYDMYIYRKEIAAVEKDMDFVFGYTITYIGRKYLHDSLYNGIAENSKFKIYANDRFWNGGRNDVIPQNEYFKEVNRAKFSYVVPANNKKEFSIQRFYECISRRCIPLIDSRCVLDNAFSEQRDILEFWKQNKLIVDLSKTTINKRISKLDYSSLIQSISELDSVKRLEDRERYERFCKNFSKNVKNMFTN